MTGIPNQKERDVVVVLKRRVYAFWIDFFLITFLYKAFLYVYIDFIKKAILFFQLKEMIFEYSFIVYFPLFSIIFCAYFLLSSFLSNGKTPGKGLLKLKIHSVDHRDLSMMSCLLRALTTYICYLPMGLLLMIPFFSKNGRGLPDWVSGTHVCLDKEDYEDEKQFMASAS